MVRYAALLLVCLLFALGAVRARADTDAGRLLAIADPESPQRKAALAWWEGLDRATRVRTLRSALASEDKAVAEVAAASIGYPYLDGAELRRAHRLLHARPAHIFDAPDVLKPLSMRGDLAFGAPDFVPFFEAAVRDPTITDRSTLQRAHRVLRSAHVEALVPLLEQGNAAVFTALLWSVGLIAEYDRRDRFRETIARGLLYGLRRMRADRAGTERPRLADVQVEMATPVGGGLPAAFVEIADAALPGTTDGGWQAGDREAVLSVVAPFHWLRRWTLVLTPSPKDVPFLERIVEASLPEQARDPYGPAHLLWAMRALAAMPAERDRVRAWAKEPDERGLHAAAALAEQGEPDYFRRLVDTGENPAEGEDPLAFQSLEWLVDRTRARARVADSHLGPDGAVKWSADDRMWKRRTESVVIDDDDLAAIEDALWSRDAPVLALMTWHASTRPGRLTRERAGRLMKRLRDMGSLDWKYRTLENYDALLAELHLIAPEDLRAVLLRWLETQPMAREEILQRLARLGVAGHEPAMFAVFHTWEEPWALGRVPGKLVDEFLWRHVEGTDGDLAARAFEALLVRAGLDPRVIAVVRNWVEDQDDDTTVALPVLRTAVTRLRERDAAGALLAIAEDASYRMNVLGLVRDERVTASLQRLRRERHRGLYWQATAALAVGGDDDARREYLTLLDDDRTWIVDGLQDIGLGEDRALTNMLLDRLDSNCCLGWAAHTLLKVIYPTLPFDDAYGGAGTAATRAWLAQFAWRRSPLVPGWVPVRK